MLNLVAEALIVIASSGVGEKPGLMDINVSTVVYTVITFVIFLWVMSKYAWKPIAKMINKRADKIRKNIEDAEKALFDAEEHKKSYELKLQKVYEEIEQLRIEGRESAERLKLQLEEKAKTEAEQIIQNAKREIEFELKRVETELKSTTLNNAIKIAEELVKRTLTDDDHVKLAEEIFEHINEI